MTDISHIIPFDLFATLGLLGLIAIAAWRADSHRNRN